MLREEIYEAHKRVIERYYYLDTAGEIPPADEPMLSIPLADKDSYDLARCWGCNKVLTADDIEQHNIMPIDDAPMLAHISCLEAGISDDDTPQHGFILMKATAEIAYLFIPNSIVKLEQGIAVVRCSNTVQARDQLGRLMSGLQAQAPNVFTTRAAALAEARIIAKLGVQSNG